MGLELAVVKDTLGAPKGPRFEHGILEIPSDIPHIARIAEAYDRLLQRKFGDASYGAQVALREGLVNYAKHVNHHDKDKIVLLEGWRHDDRLYFRISAPNSGFDLEKIEWNPDDTSPVKTSGRGHAYMFHYADYLAYEKSGSAIYLGFKLQAKPRNKDCTERDGEEREKTPRCDQSSCAN